MDQNVLYYGDNLDVLRRHVKDATVDLVYLDPPFSSDVNYNVLFAEHGEKAAAQTEAFTDTWEWTTEAAAAYQEVVEQGGEVASMMAPRLVEYTGSSSRQAPSISIATRRQATTSRLLLDAVFGPENFLSEVIWRRTGTHSSANRWGPVHDVLIMYARQRGSQTWNRPYVPVGVARLGVDRYTSDHWSCLSPSLPIESLARHRTQYAPRGRHGRFVAVPR